MLCGDGLLSLVREEERALGAAFRSLRENAISFARLDARRGGLLVDDCEAL